MRLVDLFAGIGGFSYAAHHFGITTEVFVEKEKFCQKVLAQNFPGVPIIDDIFNFNINEYERITGHKTTDIICGGFPCQPFSQAGQRKGKNDDRHLWPEMFRVISELKPKWIIAENVYGLLSIEGGMVFEQVCDDLESEGYEVQTFIIPAASKNAPHKRDRLWIVANSNNRSRQKYRLPARRQMSKNGIKGKRTTSYTSKFRCNSRSNNGQKRYTYKKWVGSNKKINTDRRKSKFRTSTNRKVRNVTNSNNERLQRRELNQTLNKKGIKRQRATKRQSCKSTPQFDKSNNLGVFPTQSPVCGRNDGIPNRVDRIKALGNAIVPQVAMELFRSITEVENANIHI